MGIQILSKQIPICYTQQVIASDLSPLNQKIEKT